MGKRMITYLLVLGAVGYLFLMYIYPALSGLLIFVLLYPAAGIVYLIFAGRGLSVRVKQLSDYGEKEQQMKVSIQVCRESSLWIGKCRVLLEMEHAVSGIRQKDSLWLSEKQADYTFEPDRCGEWKLTITEVRIYDFMGILSVGKKQQEKQRFTVLPKICAMPVEIGRRTREFPVEPETYSNERGGQDATEIYQIREYHIPDPVQMIHWKISAKAGKMMVKESSHPLGCAVCIRLWLSDAAKDFKKLERMIEICASLSRTLVEEHCMHVVAWFDQKNVRVVRWRVKDEETFYEMLWESVYGKTDDNISSGAWHSGISVSDVYLSGTERAVDFCASVSGGRNRLSYFCGERTLCQSKAALGLRRKRTADESQYTGLQGKLSLDRKVQGSAGNGTCSIRHQTKGQFMAF